MLRKNGVPRFGKRLAPQYGFAVSLRASPSRSGYTTAARRMGGVLQSRTKSHSNPFARTESR
jgi:hypothetical protein